MLTMQLDIHGKGTEGESYWESPICRWNLREDSKVC